ncbi:MAG: hypothetical protein ABI811_06580 [Acidobacteriota bacterium]
MTRLVSFKIALLCVLGLPGLLAQAAKSPADDLYQQATASMQKQDFGQAEFLFREMRTAFPQDDRWGLGLFAALDRQNKLADALKVAREIHPKSDRPGFYNQRIGVVLLRLDRAPEALTEFQTALRLTDSTDLSEFINNMIGDAYLSMDRLDDALTAYRKAKELLGRASLPLAFALGVKGHDEEEIREYRAVLRDTPGQTMAMNNLAYALAERDESLDEALSLSLRAVAAVPGSSVMTDTLGWVYYKKRMFEDAETTMVDALIQEGGTHPTLRKHLVAVLDARAEWTPDRRALRALLDTGSKPDEIARMKELLRKVRVR